MKPLITVVAAAGISIATVAGAASAQTLSSVGSSPAAATVASHSSDTKWGPCLVPVPTHLRQCAVPRTPRPCVVPVPTHPRACSVPVSPTPRPSVNP